MAKQIVIIGSGNVATHLGVKFSDAGCEILHIHSQNEEHAKALADNLGAEYGTDLTSIPPTANLYVLAVKDEIIGEISKGFTIQNGMIVHTSGSVGMEVFDDNFVNYGVFYPLQTFSKNIDLVSTKFPICVEANNQENLNLIKDLGIQLVEEKNVHEMNSEQRKVLHLAAVFACNFSNHMFSIAETILKDKGLAFDLLRPLIRETVKKIQKGSPADMQTGPAKRNDTQIIDNQLNYLKDIPEFEQLYKLITQSISANKS